jgi:hypothetical protein
LVGFIKRKIEFRIKIPNPIVVLRKAVFIIVIGTIFPVIKEKNFVKEVKL